jgi:hypothetical protein
MVVEVLERLAGWRTLAIEEVRVTEETVRFAPVDLSGVIEPSREPAPTAS